MCMHTHICIHTYVYMTDVVSTAAKGFETSFPVVVEIMVRLRAPSLHDRVAILTAIVQMIAASKHDFWN